MPACMQAWKKFKVHFVSLLAVGVVVLNKALQLSWIRNTNNVCFQFYCQVVIMQYFGSLKCIKIHKQRFENQRKSHTSLSHLKDTIVSSSIGG